MSASMAEGMAEILRDHKTWRYTNGAGTDIVCSGCGAPVRNVLEHQAEMLAANGYGKLEDAWDEGLSAGCDRWLDAREFGDPPVNPYQRPE